jgi:hypothetical protein
LYGENIWKPLVRHECLVTFVLSILEGGCRTLNRGGTCVGETDGGWYGYEGGALVDKLEAKGTKMEGTNMEEGTHGWKECTGLW